MQSTLKTFIITGATSGLGLSTAKLLSKNTRHRVILAVRDIFRGKEVAASLGANIEVRHLDLTSLESIELFVSSWNGEITGLINNAGVQIVNDTRMIHNESIEETFAVNHLGAFKLTQGLLPFMDSGRVLFIGSGTHNPDYIFALAAGFEGAKF